MLGLVPMCHYVLYSLHVCICLSPLIFQKTECLFICVLQPVDNVHRLQRPIGVARIRVRRCYVHRRVYSHSLHTAASAGVPSDRHASTRGHRWCGIP